MRAKRACAFLVVSLMAGLCLPVWSMDLMQAYQAALEQDATLRAARAAARAGRERLPQASAQLLPSVSFSAARSRNDLSRTLPDTLGQLASSQEKYVSSNQTLTVRQPLYRKPLLASREQARSVVEDVDATLDQELQNLAVRVSLAYLEALLAQDQLELVLAQEEATTIQLDAARKALAAGSGTRTDIDEAQARLDMALAQALEARQNLDFTRRKLQVLVNQPPGELARLDVSRIALLALVPARVDDWNRMAEEHSPEVRALRSRGEAARLEVDKATGAHHPTLDAVAQWSRSRSENVTSLNASYTNKSLGLQLAVPLYAGGYVSSTVRQALAEQERAAELLEALRRDLGVRVHREYRGVTEGVARVKALEQAVRSAQQMVQSSRRSFLAGSRTRLDILNAVQQQQTALRDLAQARYLYLASRIRLQALVGGDMLRVIREANDWLAP